MNENIRVGFTENHGVCAEQMEFPPDGVHYSVLNRLTFGSRLFKSPIKGFMSRFDTSSVDVVEAVISPVITEKPWIYSLAVYEEALAFSFLGLPSPKSIRQMFMKRLLSKENFKKLLFWSRAGMETLSDYGGIHSGSIFVKSAVVYPAVRRGFMTVT